MTYQNCNYELDDLLMFKCKVWRITGIYVCSPDNTEKYCMVCVRIVDQILENSGMKDLESARIPEEILTASIKANEVKHYKEVKQND